MGKRKSSGVNVLARECVMVRLDAIQPHPRNPRQGDVGAICESIKANGFFAPCIVQQSTAYILAGNHRWMAARELGMSEVPVVWLDVDDDRALRILLADNRTSDLAAYDDPALAALLQEIMEQTGTLLGTGFDGDALDELLADLGQGVGESDFPVLATGDKQPFQQMTFTLHDSQAEQVKVALEAAGRMGPYVDSPNENGNGNALARVCETFLTEHANR